MPKFIVADCGAQQLSCGVYDAGGAGLSEVSVYPVKSADPRAYAARFRAVCGAAADMAGKADGILLCGDPEEFLAAGPSGSPLTDIINGGDLAFRPVFDGVTALDALRRELGDSFYFITGFRPGPATPSVVFAACAALMKLEGACRLFTLPQWVAFNCAGYNGRVHETLAAGLGFYDIFERAPALPVGDAIGTLCGCAPDYGEAVAGFEPCAEFDGIAVYCGVGSRQCAVLGAGCRPAESVFVSVGGSSGVYAPAVRAPEADLLPYFDCMRLSAVTGLPGFAAAARELAAIAPGFDANALLTGVSAAMPVWARETEGLSAPGAAAAALDKIAASCAGAARSLAPGNGFERCLLGGEYARRWPALRELVSREMKLEAELVAVPSETIAGLCRLADGMTAPAAQ